MSYVEEGQTMYDAYDALIFMKPLEKTNFSGHTAFYITKEFKREMVHRIEVMYGHDLDAFLHRHKVNSIEEYIENHSKPSPEKSNPLVK